LGFNKYFYDLIWFLQNNVKPNFERGKQIIKAEHEISVKNYDDIWELIRQRINKIDTKGIYIDLRNMVKNPESVKRLSENFLDIYERLVAKL